VTPCQKSVYTFTTNYKKTRTLLDWGTCLPGQHETRRCEWYHHVIDFRRLRQPATSNNIKTNNINAIHPCVECCDLFRVPLNSDDVPLSDKQTNSLHLVRLCASFIINEYNIVNSLKHRPVFVCQCLLILYILVSVCFMCQCSSSCGFSFDISYDRIIY